MPSKARKRKVYDDKALALALAHQTKPTSQIAREFGLGEAYVRKIRRGQRRPRVQRMIRKICEEVDDDLFFKACETVGALLKAQIRTALTGPRGLARRCREYLLDRFLLPEGSPKPLIQQRSHAESGASCAARGASCAARGASCAVRRASGRRRKFYDEDSLVRDVAEGRLSLRKIARKHNVDPQLVCRIRQGRTRPDLTARIDELRQLIQVESSRQVGPWIKRLLAEELRVGITGTDDTARICRHYVLDRFLLPQSDSEAAGIAERWARRRNGRRWIRPRI